MTRETFQLLTQEIINHTGRNPTGNSPGRPAILPEKQMLLFLWSVQTGNRIVQSSTLGRETKPDISCEWNTKFSIIPAEIPTNKVNSKRIPKFSKTFPGIFTVPFNFGPEISKFLVEWKAPQLYSFRALFVLYEAVLDNKISYTSCLLYSHVKLAAAVV